MEIILIKPKSNWKIIVYWNSIPQKIIKLDRQGVLFTS